MQHSAMFSMIRDFYEKNLWTITQVKNAVLKEKITPEEYQEITGQSYE